MATKKASSKKGTMTKSALIDAVVEAAGEVELSRKQVKAVFDALANVGYKELKKNELFTIPGFVKFRVVTKKKQPAQERMNPFTKKMQMFPAKPARKIVRARPIKAVKDLLK